MDHNPVEYYGTQIQCSVCGGQVETGKHNQVWITLRVATEILPLLANLCSKECFDSLPTPPENYMQYPHKGGSDLVQPDLNEWTYLKSVGTSIILKSIEKENKSEIEEVEENKSNYVLIKLKRKIWKE